MNLTETFHEEQSLFFNFVSDGNELSELMFKSFEVRFMFYSENEINQLFIDGQNTSWN